MQRFLLLLLLILSGPRSMGQSDWIAQYGLSWNIATPIGRDFVEGTTVSGGQVEFLVKPGKKPLMVGLQIEWSTYDTYTPTATYYFDNGNSAITTDYYAYQYNLPLLACAQWYFGKSNRFFPWTRASMGGQYSLQQLYYGDFLEEYKSWGFAAKGEAGMSLLVSQHLPLMISLSSGILYATNGAAELGDMDWMSWDVQLGIVFRQF